MEVLEGQVYINTKKREWLTNKLTVKSIDPYAKDFIYFEEKPATSYHYSLLDDYYTLEED